MVNIGRCVRPAIAFEQYPRGWSANMLLVGLFQMLKGRTIAGRHKPDGLPAESPMDPDYMQDPFLASGNTSFSAGENISSTTGLPFTISSPKCAQL
jgi:hypothetical protein